MEKNSTENEKKWNKDKVDISKNDLSNSNKTDKNPVLNKKKEKNVHMKEKKRHSKGVKQDTERTDKISHFIAKTSKTDDQNLENKTLDSAEKDSEKFQKKSNAENEDLDDDADETNSSGNESNHEYESHQGKSEDPDKETEEKSNIKSQQVNSDRDIVEEVAQENHRRRNDRNDGHVENFDFGDVGSDNGETGGNDDVLHSRTSRSKITKAKSQTKVSNSSDEALDSKSKKVDTIESKNDLNNEKPDVENESPTINMVSHANNETDSSDRKKSDESNFYGSKKGESLYDENNVSKKSNKDFDDLNLVSSDGAKYKNEPSAKNDGQNSKTRPKFEQGKSKSVQGENSDNDDDEGDDQTLPGATGGSDAPLKIREGSNEAKEGDASGFQYENNDGSSDLEKNDKEGDASGFQYDKDDGSSDHDKNEKEGEKYTFEESISGSKPIKMASNDIENASNIRRNKHVQTSSDDKGNHVNKGNKLKSIENKTIAIRKMTLFSIRKTT
ncbi:protein PFC0760c-like [Xenia sp. Carnegie-2017]|uniref:protein PFC0760c-like n=1 Tax=Xenia sp. Carnegie-2017 TaxID=2897299 RepID=UPI001F0446A9|nr:protein PFC0760c-like [Xenia sp. Carnegie-2017]